MKKPFNPDEKKIRTVKKVLNSIFLKYHTGRFIGMDPLCCVRPFKSSKDREIGGLTASSLAYGRVEQIIKSVTKIFAAMGNNPYDFTISTDFKEKKAALSGFKHRFNTGGDIALLLECLKTVYKDFNSLENLFALGLEPDDLNIRHALEKFILHIRRRALEIAGNVPASFNYLICSPESGSACKRINMFLRWMVRDEDGVDMGIWEKISPCLLVMPVDVHVARAGKSLGLTDRNTADWVMAEQITEMLKKVDPADPVKYDFSLCRYGMMLFRNQDHDG